MHAAPTQRDLVLIGGGHAHVAVIKGLAMHPIPGMRLTVVTRDVMTPYSGMLPGFLAGNYTFEESHIDLLRLCRFAGARLLHSSVNGINLERRQLSCTDRPVIGYDFLSVDIGSVPSRFGIPGADAHAIPIKPVDVFLRHLERIQQSILTRDDTFRIVIIGGGAGGTELCLSLRNRFRNLLISHGANPGRADFSIVSQGPTLLPQHSSGVVRRMHRVIADSGVTLHLMRRVTGIGATHVTLSDGTRLPFDAAILASHASAASWLTQTDLALDARGFIRVHNTLQSVSHKEVFAAGDIAAIDGHSLEKSGVYAVRQGPVLLDNLRRAVHGKKLSPFRPQARTLALISTGSRHAVASYGSIALQGKSVWRLKDRIDRRWMRKYQQLPEMPGLVMAQADSMDAMPCGGCAAKIPANILARALGGLTQNTAAGITIGLSAPDDAAVIAPQTDRLLVQTTDQFRTFTDDLYLFARITANHCLNDIYAMGAEPHSALALITLPFGMEEKLLEELQLILRGVTEVFADAAVTLIGGHTAQGAEMMLGFTINGFVRNSDLLRKGGALPGDALILTKPLGAGAILAADMRAKAHASWLDEAVSMMLHSNARAMRCLQAHGATSCTDVSGFGLAGHLGEMLRASKLPASLDLEALPSLAGARACMADGIFSSLHPANMRDGETLLQVSEEWRRHPNYPLLFDPQTSGGLLASVPSGRADACVTALRSAGYAHAVIIGATLPRGQDDTVLTLRATTRV